jgi:hypothetical protein
MKENGVWLVPTIVVIAHKLRYQHAVAKTSGWITLASLLKKHLVGAGLRLFTHETAGTKPAARP